MAWDINQVVLVGRLTRDPETAYTKSNIAVCKFSIANNKGTGQNADDVSFFDIVVWDKAAASCQQFLQKGRQVIVSGRLKQSRFTDKNGQSRSKVEINASNVQFIGGRDNDSGGDFKRSDSYQPPAAEPKQNNYGGSQQPQGFDDFDVTDPDPF